MTEIDKAIREQDRIAKVATLMSKEERSRTDWRRNLRKKKNQLLGDVQNISLALQHAPELDGMLRMNELSHRIEFLRPPPWRTLTRGNEWMDDDDVDLAAWLQDWEVPVRSELTVSRVVRAHASKRPYNPVREWLDKLTWDGEPRISEVLIEVLSAKGNGLYLSSVLRRFMISAVARAMKPGCKADYMLVLVGDQGRQKSSFVHALGEPWTADANSAFGTKDAIAELDGVWIMELGELSGMKKSEVETVKFFVSRQVDRYRPAYARAAINQPRSCVFVGTTNEHKFLMDSSGNRRFWPVQCADRIDLKLLREHRDMLWAEAVAAWRAGEPWYLTGDEARLAHQVQEDHRIVSELEADVAEKLEYIRVGRTIAPSNRTTVAEVYELLVGDRERGMANRRMMETNIAAAIRACGWVYVGRLGAARRSTYEYRAVPE